MKMIGRRVRSIWGKTGIVLQWEPLGAAMCDVLVREDDGREVWHGSSSLKPEDGARPLPSRRVVQEQARLEAVDALESIRASLVQELKSVRWPGCEFGKAILGQAIDNALKEIKR